MHLITSPSLSLQILSSTMCIRMHLPICTHLNLNGPTLTIAVTGLARLPIIPLSVSQVHHSLEQSSPFITNTRPSRLLVITQMPLDNTKIVLLYWYGMLTTVFNQGWVSCCSRAWTLEAIGRCMPQSQYSMLPLNQTALSTNSWTIFGMDSTLLRIEHQDSLVSYK
jgi:hypothetical protein